MHIHILGICGTFMGGLAMLARAQGITVSGSDENVYPPMSDQLRESGIDVQSGYLPEHLDPAPDLVVMGNAMSRGNPAVEYVLNKGLPYTSGPQWLAHALRGRWVLGVAGTHGKTTTSSMLAWLLEDAGMKPGFLIGGVPANFGETARWGDTPFFVIEADEYDTAFFDKRSKFIHYMPRTLLINNLEFDHADIFADLAAIQTQFHHLIRTVPSEGLLITPNDLPAVEETLERGTWTPRKSVGINEGDLQARDVSADGTSFTVFDGDEHIAEVTWDLMGDHNVLNALGALLAAQHVGVSLAQGCAALETFKGVKRRMELRGEVDGVRVYDDFAHHPTAIATTINGLRANIDKRKIIAILEPRSNTMKMGVHRNALANALRPADHVLIFDNGELDWSLNSVTGDLGPKAETFSSVDALVLTVKQIAAKGDVVLVMSNGGFGGIHQKLLDALAAR